jgi:hypothetical protein
MMAITMRLTAALPAAPTPPEVNAQQQRQR